MEIFLKIWNEGAAVFTTTGYAMFNIEAHLVCMIILTVLCVKQQDSSDQTEAQITWLRMLFIQILYCFSGILRVLVDINLVPKSNLSQYIVTAINFGLFGCLCWLTFVYIEIYQNSKLLNSLRNKILVAVPFTFNVLNLIASPWISSFIDISGKTMVTGKFFTVMVSINLAYPTIASIFTFIRRSRMNRYERELVSATAIYPALFLVCGPLQALNWRIPFLCYAIMISDIVVYMSYSGSLVFTDPMTKIPNKNALLRNLSDKLASEDTDNLYLIAVDVDDLNSINANYRHSEGDRALTIIANALTKFSQEEHICYISRYFGDKFIITANIQDDDALELFIEHIKNYISNARTINKLPYRLRVNIGWAKYEQYSQTETISGLLEEADKSLDDNKEHRRLQNILQNERI